MIKKIILDFKDFTLEAELFHTEIAEKFFNNLPYEIELTAWGEELYGPIGQELGEEAPVTYIPDGGLAYTSRGNYLCIFYGQTPAWPVEYLGSITSDWQGKLNPGLKKVTVRKNEGSVSNTYYTG